MSDNSSIPGIVNISISKADPLSKQSSEGSSGEVGISKDELATIERVNVVVTRFKSQQRRIEMITLTLTLFLILGIGFAAWYSEGAIFGNTLNLLRSVEGEKASKNVLLNCQNPKNQTRPYCQDRAASQQQTWSAVTHNHRGKSPAFSLHKR